MRFILKRKKAQASLETLFAVGVIIILFTIAAILTIDRTVRTEGLRQELELRAECLRLAGLITEVFSGGAGTAINTSVSSDLKIFAQSRALAVRGAESSYWSYCTLPVSRISNGGSGNFSLQAGQLLLENHDGTVYISGKELIEDTTAPKVIGASPSGTIADSVVTLAVTTDEVAQCKYDVIDIDYYEMANSFISVSTSHTSEVGPLEDGKYTYYVRCADTSKNVMQKSAKIQFIVNTTAEDISPPAVTLLSPANNSALKNNVVTFEYNVTDEFSISSCSLLINGVVNETDSSVAKDVIQNFTAELANGLYTWNIKCTDEFGNEGTGVERELTINTLTLKTDKNSYLKYEDVVITGGNYTRNETVTLSILDSGNKLAPGYPLNITGDANGSISHIWNTGLACSGTYSVTAKDLSTNLSASTNFNITFEADYFSYLATPEATPDWKAQGTVTPADVEASDNVWGYFDVDTSEESWVEFDFSSLGIPSSETPYNSTITIEFQDEKKSFTNKEVRCFDADKSTWIIIDYQPIAFSPKLNPKKDITVTYTLDPACYDSELNSIKIRYGFFISADSGKAYIDFAQLNVSTKDTCTKF